MKKKALQNCKAFLFQTYKEVERFLIDFSFNQHPLLKILYFFFALAKIFKICKISFSMLKTKTITSATM